MRKIIAQVGKHITDCMDIKLGLKAMDETRPEYWMLNEILTDEMAELILKMKVRNHQAPAQARGETDHQGGRGEDHPACGGLNMQKVFCVSLAVLLPAWAIYQQSMRELDRLNLFDPSI